MVQLVEDIGLPDLSNQQIEEICSRAEDAAREYVFSKFNKKLIEKLDIIVEANGMNPLRLNVEVNLVLVSGQKDLDSNKIASEAVQEAFKASERMMRNNGLR